MRFGLSICLSDKQRSRNSIPSLEQYSDDLRAILNGLSTDERMRYDRIIQRTVKYPAVKNFVGWNIQCVSTYINDVPFKQAILHTTGYSFNPDIQFAITLGTDVRQSVVAKMLSYSIFLGKSDVDLYKEWKILPKQIAWFRLLFADFTHFPQSDVAKWSVLRQLTNNEIITEVDFNYFKRISELGEVALKAQCAFHTLTEDERTTIESYLGNTAIVNVLDQHTAIRTAEDGVRKTRDTEAAYA
jgi:hypothetical protein